MEELYRIVKAINRLEEAVASLMAKMDILLKSPFRNVTLDEEAACRLLKISPRLLASLRSEGKIPFVKIHRRIVYRAADLYQYLNEHVNQSGTGRGDDK